MKTQKIIIAMTILSTLIISCKKSSPSPEKTVAPSVTSTLTPTETALLGNWCQDKNELYSNGSLLTGPGGTVNFNDCSIYHIQFNSTAKVSPVDPTGSYMECIDGVTGNGNISYWQIMSNSKLNIGGGVYTIETLTSTYLCYYTGSLTTGSAIKYIFHKI